MSRQHRPAMLAFVAVLAAAAPIPPSPTRWVDDSSGFLSQPARSALDSKLESYERATGHQVVVWIGKTLGGAPLDDWAVRTFAAWRVGRKGLDDGVAMFVLSDDRNIDIEVGYGLEDRLPDAIASRIIREVMAPRLRAGDRDGAVTAGTDAVLAAIEGQPWTGGQQGEAQERGPSLATWILGALAIAGFLIFAITHPRMAMLLLWTIMANGRHGGGGLGGGFGGGGGRSGGGGARGGW